MGALPWQGRGRAVAVPWRPGGGRGGKSHGVASRLDHPQAPAVLQVVGWQALREQGPGRRRCGCSSSKPLGDYTTTRPLVSATSVPAVTPLQRARNAAGAPKCPVLSIFRCLRGPRTGRNGREGGPNPDISYLRDRSAGILPACRGPNDVSGQDARAPVCWHFVRDMKYAG